METDGDIITQYQNNKSATIKNAADNVKIVLDDTNNSSETITLTNSTGTGNNAIGLTSTLGGVTLTGANSSITMETDGDVITQFQNNKSATIKNAADNVKIVLDDTNNSSETITLTNSTGTGNNAIGLPLH